jgi:hypothetical protein
MLSEGEHHALKAKESGSATLPICFDINDANEGALERGLKSLCEVVTTIIQVGS